MEKLFEEEKIITLQIYYLLDDNYITIFNKWNF